MIKKIKQVNQSVKKDFNNAERFIIKKQWIIFGSIILILLIFLGIYSFTKPNSDMKFQELDIIVYNLTTLPMDLYHYQNKIGYLSGFNSKLNYNEKEDRLFGKEDYKKIVFDDNGTAYTVISTSKGILLDPLTTNPEKVSKIGWFTNPEQIKVKKNKKDKKINIELNSETLNTNYTYDLYKKPYFKIQFSAQTENYSKLGAFGYGLSLQGYDIYLPNSTILKNDNKIVDEGKTIDIILRKDGQEIKNISQDLLKSISEKVDTTRQIKKRTGSIYEIKNQDYQIFYNSNKSLAVIAYSPNLLYFEDSFYWNVYRIYVPHLGQGKYPALYIIILENPEFIYNNTTKDWYVSSKKYSGNIKDYINNIILKIQSGEAKKSNINDYIPINKIINLFKK